MLRRLMFRVESEPARAESNLPLQKLVDPNTNQLTQDHHTSTVLDPVRSFSTSYEVIIDKTTRFEMNNTPK